MSSPDVSPNDNPQLAMRSIIQRIATGPELSKDISLAEARFGMSAILDGIVDPVQAAIFLIALRMKRETDDENRGVLDAIRAATERVTAAVDEVVDIADPYDGYNRTLPPSPFLPAVLATLGVPSFSHGVETVGPKYGATHRKVLRAAGVPVDLTPAEAAARIADARVGWAYVDQSTYCPKLHALIDFRTKIVKRPAITTVEVMAGPIVGRRRTHLLTGYVHKPYPRIYALLARHAGYDSALLVRGVEGGVIPSLRQKGKFFYYRDRSEEESIEIEPTTLGIQQEVRAVPMPEDLPQAQREGDEIAVTLDVDAAAKLAAERGFAALEGEPGPTRDGLVYAGAMVLWHLGKVTDVRVGAQLIREVLDSGRAINRFRAEAEV